MVSTPAELRQWRALTGATQEGLAQVLGIGMRSILSWERAEISIPPLLPWALVAAQPHVESHARAVVRARRSARRRKARAAQRKRRNAIRAAERAVSREQVAAERRLILTERAERERMAKKAINATLRAGDQFVRDLERKLAKERRQAPPSLPDGCFIQPPRPQVVRPRLIRSDLGQPHNFRGRPGRPLRPKELNP